MSDVFVSYKAEDRARVRPLVEALEADGLSVWWDAHVGGGEEWRDSIQRQLDEAKCVIVVWSKRSIGPEGHFVRDEASRALRRHAYLPVRIDKVDPPLGFGETQAISLSGWKSNRSDPRFQSVLAAVRAIISGGPRPHLAHVESPGVSRRAIMAGGAGAVAAAAAGGWFLLKPGSAKANSIAVLPFANLSGDPAQAYFSDGMAEELRSSLSRIAGLKVVARTSSEMLRDADAKTAAAKLEVANVLTGSVRRSPSMIRVNTQLVDGKDGLERWSQSFDRPAGDVLTIQTEIAESVAQALSIELADKAALRVGGTTNAQAQDLLLRAQQTRRDDSESSFRSALSLIDQAIALDPNYAEAHARKAFILTYLASVHALGAEQVRREGELAFQSARRAIALAPRLAAGHSALSNILRDQLQMGPALRESEIAFEVGGVDELTLQNHAYLLMQSGRRGEAEGVARRIIKLDPLNPASFETQAVTHYYARHYQQAVAVGRRGIRMAPERLRMRAFVAHAHLQLGQADIAAREYARLPSGDYRRLLGEAVIAARAGDVAAAERARETMQQRYGDAAHFQYGQIYAQLRRPDQALNEFELARKFRDAGLGYLRIDPFLDPIRSDPRFEKIVAKLDFPAT